MKCLIALVALLAITSAVYAAEFARADIFPLSASEDLLGLSYAEFETLNDTHVRVHIVIDGLSTNPDAAHGIHIHQYGDLSDPTGALLGGHWNPFNVDHGCGELRSAGDLGNWTFTGGSLNETRDFDLLALTGENSIIGRGIVVHAETDNCVTVASSGTRLLAGVIGIENVAGNTASAAPSFNQYGTYAARCVIVPTTTYGAALNPPLAGIFTFNQTAAGQPTVVNGWINTNGTFGTHVHTFGDLSGRADGLSTAGHFDPKSTSHHALPGATEAHHAGDMGNTNPDNFDGTSLGFTGAFPDMTIQNVDSASIIGRGLVIHALADDGGQPTGNAGNRNGMCVIGLTASALNSAPVAPPSGNAAALSASALLFVVTLLAALL